MIAQIIPLVGALGVLLPILIPLAQFVIEALSQKFLPENVAYRLQGVVNTVVNGIEQSMPTEPGVDKKAAAEAKVNEILNHFGIHVPPSLVDMLIEEAVSQLEHYAPPAAPMGFSAPEAQPPSPATIPGV